MEVGAGGVDIFYFLCAAYALLSSFTLIQLIRFHLRTLQHGWTRKKLFHFMVFIFSGVRAIMFGFHVGVFSRRPKVLTTVLVDLPGILFFTTFTLLVLFWAEMYHQTTHQPCDIRKYYIAVNIGVYAVEICFWTYLWFNEDSVVNTVGKIFLAVVSFVAAIGFAVYGKNFFCILNRFPTQSEERNRRLYEVGSVATICSTCFFVRSVVEAFSATSVKTSRTTLDHPVLSLVSYTFMELLPSALVLFILRKMP